MLLLSIFIFSCSSNQSDVEGNVQDFVIGTWTLTKEEWIADRTWPAGQARGCFMTDNAGSPDQLIVTENNATKKVWECFQDGSLAVDLTVYGPVSWSNLGENMYSFDGENVEITFIDNNEMQMPIDGGQILQTWKRN